MATGGSALNWFVRQFAAGEAQAADAGRPLDPSMARPPRRGAPAGSEGLVVTPYFLGEKTPIHDADARATFDGLTLSHDIGHLWRALLEAYAYAHRASRRGHERDRLQDRALYRLRRRLGEPGMDADRRRRPAAPASAAGRPSRAPASAPPGRPRSARASRPIGRRSPPSCAPPIGSSPDLKPPMSTDEAIAAIATSIAACGALTGAASPHLAFSAAMTASALVTAATFCIA